MKEIIRIWVLSLVFVFCSFGASFSEQAPPKIFKLAETELAHLGENPVIVAAVKAENEKKKSLDQIKKMDETWRNTPGIADDMKAMMVSDCGKFLQKVQKSKAFYSEIFVMDNQGANVAMTEKTSDYWQGDEDKFVKSYNNEKGAVFVDEVKFDESSQAYLVQASVPVKDGGRVIGAITFGINLDEVE